MLETYLDSGGLLVEGRELTEEHKRPFQWSAEVARSYGLEPSSPIDYALRACDEITGLIIAGVYVRPQKDVRKMKVKSVKRNWKDKHFCAAVSREEVTETTAAFSEQCFDGKLELWQHVGNVLEAMKGAAEVLELDGRMAAAAPKPEPSA